MIPVPIRCQEVPVFVEGYLGHKDLYKDVMMDNQPPLTSPDGSSNRNPPERCPRHLYSAVELKDIKVEVKEEEEEKLVTGDQQSMEEGDPLCSSNSIKEDPYLLHHDQGEKLKDIKAEIKEEEETMVRGDQQSMEEGGPLYSGDSTQEDLTVPHHHQEDLTIPHNH
ncbi:uncharacterized protein ACMZJ9_015126 [Mantella aurantiaca]